MKQVLTKNSPGIFHFVNGKKIYGLPSDLWGSVSGLSGNVSGLSGDVSGLWGDASGLIGDVTGLRGDVTGLRGDIDDCCITDAERATGVDILELVKSGA